VSEFAFRSLDDKHSHLGGEQFFAFWRQFAQWLTQKANEHEHLTTCTAREASTCLVAYSELTMVLQNPDDVLATLQLGCSASMWMSSSLPSSQPKTPSAASVEGEVGEDQGKGIPKGLVGSSSWMEGVSAP